MVSLTLRTHQTGSSIPGFVRQELSIPHVRYDDTLDQVISNLNQYRVGSSVITRLYNMYGQEIPRITWYRFRIREHIILYIDQPTASSSVSART